ncbi:MAG: sodium/proline symporter [Enterobacterales bacterium]
MIVWKQLSGGIFELYEILPGSMLASIAIVIVSKVDKKPEQSVLDTFDEVKKIIHIHS